jgi:hypothetical protein
MNRGDFTETYGWAPMGDGGCWATALPHRPGERAARRALAAGPSSRPKAGGRKGPGVGAGPRQGKASGPRGGGGVAGWAARGSWLAVPRGGLAGWLGRAKETSPGGRGFFLFCISYFLFSFNLLLSAYFMETKQLHTREIDAWFDMMQQPKKPTSRIYYYTT